MNKTVIAIATAFAVLAAGNASAQVAKAASEASDAAEHKIDQKRAEDKAAKSGPVGKAVNNVKADYHKNRAERSADKAKQSIKRAAE